MPNKHEEVSKSFDLGCSAPKWITKRELASKPGTMTCPPIPPKVRRGSYFSRTLFTIFGDAKPIAVRQDGITPPLSPLYNKNQNKSYLDQLFEFRIKIGEGCFGCVYKAFCCEDRKFYAIKCLKENSGTSTSKEKEIRNYQIFGTNDYCVNFIRAWVEHQKYYIQMEYCIMSLATYAAENHSFPQEQLWDILIDMLLALQHLHKNNYIHLDLKPDNIMISERCIYKLGDFGLAVNLKELNDKNKRVLNASEGDSKYLASEVLEGIYTTSCDIFSLGMTLLELSTDLVLPPNGALWHELRNGIFPEIFFQSVGIDIANIIRSMMLNCYQLRPSVNKLLQMHCIQSILKKREFKPRVNYLSKEVPNLNRPVVVNEEPKLLADSVETSSPTKRVKLIISDVAGTSGGENSSFESVTSPSSTDSNPATPPNKNCSGVFSPIKSTDCLQSFLFDAAASPSSTDSNPSTPPSSSKNHFTVFSPIKSKDRQLHDERVAIERKTRKQQLFHF